MQRVLTTLVYGLAIVVLVCFAASSGSSPLIANKVLPRCSTAKTWNRLGEGKEGWW